MMENEINNGLPDIQWFPGHMAKAKRLIQENLKLVDVVIELLDARIPNSSANPMLKEIIGDKPRLVALNKSDLADEQETKKWLAHFREEGVQAVAIDAMQGKGVKQLVKLTGDLAKAKTQKFVKKGGKPRAARVMILGIPNVGKSSLINRLAGSNKAKAEDRPGVTKAKQWIAIGRDLNLLDTPGILWPKFSDMMVGVRLAFTGAIKDEVYDHEKITVMLLEYLAQNYPASLTERYKLKELSADGHELLEMIGRKRGCLVKGGIVDLEKAQYVVLHEFRAGKLGRITLDKLAVQEATE